MRTNSLASPGVGAGDYTRAGSRVVPAHWEPHRAVWLAWPHRAVDWPGCFESVREEMASFSRAVCGEDGSEVLEVLVRSPQVRADAEAYLSGLPVRYHQEAYADIWLRDTGPIFVVTDAGELEASGFRFNGWGGRFPSEEDASVAETIAKIRGVPMDGHEFVLEGGALEHNGAGVALTTAQCLQNANRGARSAKDAEFLLGSALGIHHLFWLDRGLMGDHTDGHVDNLARFAPGNRILIGASKDASADNQEVLREIAMALAEFAQKAELELVEVPSTQRIEDGAGVPFPASYLNFYVGNTAVVVPAFGLPSDHEAAQAIGACFPGRRVCSSPARSLLTGGGTFHCMTLDEPSIAATLGASDV